MGDRCDRSQVKCSSKIYVIFAYGSLYMGRFSTLLKGESGELPLKGLRFRYNTVRENPSLSSPLEFRGITAQRGEIG